MEKPGWRLGCSLMIALALSLLLCGCECDGQGTLFEDGFENPGSGWGADQRDGFDRGYDDGVYFFDLRASNWLAWAHPGRDFSDVSIEVDARVASGAQDGHYGVLCRYQDADGFYYFAVSADGYYAIFRRAEGDMKILTGDGSGMLPSPHIKTGTQVNRVPSPTMSTCGAMWGWGPAAGRVGARASCSITLSSQRHSDGPDMTVGCGRIIR
jgi:hypothetical protein